MVCAVRTLTAFDVAAVVVVLSAIFGVFNHRVLRMPFTIGLTVSGLVASVLVVWSHMLLPGLPFAETFHGILARIDFHESLMHGMLGFLLFAGALHLDVTRLRAQRATIAGLAVFGTIISTVLVGVVAHQVFRLAGVPVSFAYALVFGALISPTDPIAVLGIMKTSRAPEVLETKIAGESLFNDGVAVILVSLLLAAASGHGAHEPSVAGVAVVFVREVVGGVALGLGAGFLVFLAMRRLDEPNLEILLSVALVMGLTAAAFQLHTSAPLACVAAGLLIGNTGRALAMSARTRQALDLVWSFIDETLNAALFLLVGLELVVVSRAGGEVTAALVMIPVVLAARWCAVLVPISVLKLRRAFTPHTVAILTWGGLKGGISVALALALPDFPGRDTVVLATYAVVAFSIVVQGLTVGWLIRRLVPVG
jgi:CPA1 family monovalent cation:H+ antiporter